MRCGDRELCTQPRRLNDRVVGGTPRMAQHRACDCSALGIVLGVTTASEVQHDSLAERTRRGDQDRVSCTADAIGRRHHVDDVDIAERREEPLVRTREGREPCNVESPLRRVRSAQRRALDTNVGTQGGDPPCEVLRRHLRTGERRR